MNIFHQPWAVYISEQDQYIDQNTSNMVAQFTTYEKAIQHLYHYRYLDNYQIHQYIHKDISIQNLTVSRVDATPRDIIVLSWQYQMSDQMLENADLTRPILYYIENRGSNNIYITYIQYISSINGYIIYDIPYVFHEFHPKFYVKQQKTMEYMLFFYQPDIHESPDIHQNIHQIIKDYPRYRTTIGEHSPNIIKSIHQEILHHHHISQHQKIQYIHQLQHAPIINITDVATHTYQLNQ